MLDLIRMDVVNQEERKGKDQMQLIIKEGLWKHRAGQRDQNFEEL